MDGGIEVTTERLQTLLKVADVQVEPYWPGLFAKSIESINLKDLMTNVAAGGGAAAPAPVAAASAGGAEDKKEDKKEEKKEEEEEEEDDDMGFGLFD